MRFVDVIKRFASTGTQDGEADESNYATELGELFGVDLNDR